MQIILSWVPWWLYLIGAVGVFIAIWWRLGSRPAFLYAALAAAWVSYDKGGDDRETYLLAKAERAAQDAIERANVARERSDSVAPGPDGLPDDGWRRD